MSRPELVVVTGFEIPTDLVPPRRPKHEVCGELDADGVLLHSECVGMNSLRADAEHELRSVGQRPRLLEEKVDTPFRRVTAEKRGDTSFKF